MLTKPIPNTNGVTHLDPKKKFTHIHYIQAICIEYMRYNDPKNENGVHFCFVLFAVVI